MTVNLYIVEAVGFAASVSNMYGNWLLARQSDRGWLVRIGSIILWGIYGASTSGISVMLNAVVFFGINIYGFRNWRKKAREARWLEEQRRAA